MREGLLNFRATKALNFEKIGVRFLGHYYFNLIISK